MRFCMKSHPPNRRAVPALLGFALVLLILLPAPAAANPPSSVSLSYDPAGSVLLVTIVHPTGGNPDHYIKDVTVAVNGKTVAASEYTAQSADTITPRYELKAAPGDTIDVTVTCSLFGKGSASTTVPGQASAPVTSAPSQKTPVAPIVLAAALGLALAIRKQG
jgi:hypothetical protein